MYRSLWSTIVKDYRKIPLLTSICVLSMVVAMLEGINVGLLVPLLETFDAASSGQNHWLTRDITLLLESVGLSYNLVTVLIVLTTLFLFTSALKYLVKLLTVKQREGFIVWLRSRSMGLLLEADLSYFHQEKMGTLTDTLTNQTSRAGATLSNSIEIISSLGIAVTYVIASFLLAPYLALVSICLIAIVTMGLRWFMISARKMGTVRVLRENRLASSAIETLAGIHVIKTFNIKSLRSDEFRARAEDAGEIGYSIAKNLVNMAVIQEIALFGLIAALVYIGVAVLGVTIPVIVAVLFILYRLAPHVSGINAKRQALSVALGSLEAVKATIDYHSRSSQENGIMPFEGFHKEIRIENLTFSYDGVNNVLDNVSFIVEKDKMTAITGLSGAGKTTLVELILRNYEYSTGNIRVDGSDIKDFQVNTWLGAIGMVSQDVFLFNESVLYNISLGRNDVSDDDVIDSAKNASADSFIRQLPDGYDTHLGDRGWNLSGGQRQRLSLARAILKRPDILILDEATSSLDSESEVLIQDYINHIKGSTTVIVIAHRLSTIQNSDRIVVLEEGRVVENGDWDSLVADSGVLAKLYKLQSIG